MATKAEDERTKEAFTISIAIAYESGVKAGLEEAAKMCEQIPDKKRVKKRLAAALREKAKSC